VGRRARRRSRPLVSPRSQVPGASRAAAPGASGHTARCLCGRRVTGLASLTGVPIPPAGGPARRAVLLHQGTSYLEESQRQYDAALQFLPKRVAALLPARTRLDAVVTVSSPTERQAMEQRSRTWEQAQHALRVEASDQTRLELERRIREALDTAVTAFNFLEDEELGRAAHQHAHTVGETVSRLFGCQAEYRESHFWDVCSLSLMHLRIGLSPGFTGSRLCSVCRQDLSDPAACPHVPGIAVAVEVEERDGLCSACASRWPCTKHLPETRVTVVPHAVIPEVDLHEISYVDRPRDPRARITAVELPHALLRAQLGRLPTKEEPLLCHRCQQPCQGMLTSADLLHRSS